MRLSAIDVTRGILVILMALDHTRDYWTSLAFDPLDLTQTNGLLFFTRWITHLCAPGFIFLTGVSAYLHGNKLTDKRLLANFLFSRGLFLVLLEFLIITPSWQFGYHFFVFQVIATLGLSMMILAGLIYTPMIWTTLLCSIIVLFHGNLPDKAIIEWLGDYQWLWILSHFRTGFKLFDFDIGIFAAYSMIPLFALMYLGYAFGRFYQLPAQQRPRLLMFMAGGLSLAFIALRLLGLGDPVPWDSANNSLMAFINVEKYPSSTAYLLATMACVMVILAGAEKLTGPAQRVFVVFGQASLFFYIIHLPLINAAAHLWTYIEYGVATNFIYGPNVWPEGYSPDISRTYLFWCGLCIALYWPCKYYLGLKKRSNARIFSYI